MKSVLILLMTAGAAFAADPISNPAIDALGFQVIVGEAMKERTTHRLTEEEFLKGMSEPNTLILDARSAKFYALRHVKGAVNLPFTEFTDETLARVIPTKKTRILIYCNNNFAGSPSAFADKRVTASLNLSTYPALRAYGYTNVYELGPRLKINETSIPFEGNEVKQ